jgi:hypothetical protein
MTVFADFLDLRTAVIEQVGNADISDVFPRLVKMAEVDFNRRLRCREQITDWPITVANGRGWLPDDIAEPLGLFKANGQELVATSLQAFDKLTNKDGFYAVLANEIAAPDAEYTFRYYAKVPTLTASQTATNWLLHKAPELYLYAVAEKAAKYLTNVELATAAGSLAAAEYRNVYGQDSAERFARAQVRVGGVCP